MRITLLKVIDNPQALKVVVKSPVTCHELRELILPRMPERRVTQVMCKRYRFNKVAVESKHLSNHAGDLAGLEGMGQPGAVIIPFMIDKNLSFVLQAPKSRAVDDTVAVPLKSSTVGVLCFGMLPAEARSAFLRVRSERAKLFGF